MRTTDHKMRGQSSQEAQHSENQPTGKPEKSVTYYEERNTKEKWSRTNDMASYTKFDDEWLKMNKTWLE